MAVMTQIQFPISYEQFQEANKKVNPSNLLPPGCLLHIVSRTEGGIAITNVWQDEVTARKFYAGATEASGVPIPPLTFTEVFETLP